MTKPRKPTPNAMPDDFMGQLQNQPAKVAVAVAPEPAAPAPEPAAPAPAPAPVGRPKKETESHTVRFYPEEWEAIRRAAFESRRTHSDIIRMAVCRELEIEFREETKN